MKKFISLILCAALMLSMGGTAFAEAEHCFTGIEKYCLEEKDQQAFKLYEDDSTDSIYDITYKADFASMNKLLEFTKAYIEEKLASEGFEQVDTMEMKDMKVFYLDTDMDVKRAGKSNRGIGFDLMISVVNYSGSLRLRLYYSHELKMLLPGDEEQSDAIKGFGKYCAEVEGEGVMEVIYDSTRSDSYYTIYSTDSLEREEVLALIESYIEDELVPKGIGWVYTAPYTEETVTFGLDSPLVNSDAIFDFSLWNNDHPDEGTISVTMTLPLEHELDEPGYYQNVKPKAPQPSASPEPTPEPTLKPQATSAPSSGGKGALAKMVEEYEKTFAASPTPAAGRDTDAVSSASVAKYEVNGEHISLEIPLPDLNDCCGGRLDIELYDKLKNYVHICYDGELREDELKDYIELLVDDYDFVPAIEDEARGIYAFDYYEEEIWTLYPGYGYSDEDDVAVMIVSDGGVTHMYYSVDFDYGSTAKPGSGGTKLEDLVRKYSGNGSIASNNTPKPSPTPAPTAKPKSSDSSRCDHCGGDGRVDKQRIEPGRNGKSEIVRWTEDCIYCGI